MRDRFDLLAQFTNAQNAEKPMRQVYWCRNTVRARVEWVSAAL